MESEGKKDVEIKTNELLAQYIKELAEDVKLTNQNLREKALMCGSIWAKWLSYLYKEKENMQRIQEYKQKAVKSKIASQGGADSILRMKSEDRLAEQDETVKRLNELQKKTQTNIDYIERALNILQNFGYQIHNCAEIFKMNFEH